MTSRHDELGRTLRALLQEEADAMQIDTLTASGRLQRELNRSSRLRRRRVAVAAAGLAAITAGAVGVVLWNGQTDARPAPAPADTSPSPPERGTASLGPRAENVAVVDLEGRTVRRIRGLPDDADGLSLSPDRTQIAFTTGRPAQIVTIRTDGSGLRELGPAGTFTYSPAWSPDGTMIAFMGEPASGPGPQFEIHVMDADGSDVRKLTGPRTGFGAEPPGSFGANPQWSPDGSTIVYSRDSTPETEDGWTGHIWTLSVGAGSAARLTAASAVDEGYPAYSPDGSQIAYARDGAVWVMGADGTDPHQLVADGSTPRWSPDGSLIAYTTAVAKGPPGLSVVEVATGRHRRVGDIRVRANPPVWWTNDTLLIRHGRVVE